MRMKKKWFAFSLLSCGLKHTQFFFIQASSISFGRSSCQNSTCMNRVRNQFEATWLTTSFSIFLFVAVTYFLVWNENQSINTISGLEEIHQSAVSVNIQTLENGEQHEGKLVHVVGPINILEPLTDPDYNIQVLAVKLKKRVQMYQWIEETSSTEPDSEAITSNPDTTYWYHQDWRDYLVDSSLFYSSPGHENPRKIPVQSQTYTADHVKIGCFYLGHDLKRKIYDYYHITSDVRPDRGDIKLHGGFYFHGESALEHEVGDLRVRFTYAGRQDDVYTAVGVVESSTIQPYLPKKNAYGDPIIILRKGSYLLDQVLELEIKESHSYSWRYRAVGWFQLLASVMTLHPDWFTMFLDCHWVSPSVAEESRLWVQTVLATSMTLFIISLPWLFQNPLYSITLFILSCLPMIYYSTLFSSGAQFQRPGVEARTRRYSPPADYTVLQDGVESSRSYRRMC